MKPDYAGLRIWRKSRQTGTYVGLYNSEEAGIDGEKWTCMCEEHSTMICMESYAVAVSYVSYPREWCEECRSS